MDIVLRLKTADCWRMLTAAATQIAFFLAKYRPRVSRSTALKSKFRPQREDDEDYVLRSFAVVRVITQEDWWAERAACRGEVKKFIYFSPQTKWITVRGRRLWLMWFGTLSSNTCCLPEWFGNYQLLKNDPHAWARAFFKYPVTSLHYIMTPSTQCFEETELQIRIQLSIKWRAKPLC